jgi:phosphatidylglycerol---prolipoprotein diacylglyceryl transferase
MFPILFEFFSFAVPSWHFFFALAGLCGYLFAAWMLKAFNANNSQGIVGNLFCICYVFGWFGARAFSILTEDFSVSNLGEFFTRLFEFGAMTFYGGAIAALFFGIAFLSFQTPRVYGIYFDAFVPAGVLALGLGRIGCFLNGDDYGKPVDAQGAYLDFLGVVFPNLQDTVVRYPTQLLEAAFCFALVALLVVFALKQKSKFSKLFGKGILAAWVAILSAINRFANEFLRGDPRGNFLSTNLSTSQGIALLIVAFSIFYLFFEPCFRRKPFENTSNR